jgi:hypothetical protein
MRTEAAHAAGHLGEASHERERTRPHKAVVNLWHCLASNCAARSQERGRTATKIAASISRMAAELELDAGVRAIAIAQASELFCTCIL